MTSIIRAPFYSVVVQKFKEGDSLPFYGLSEVVEIDGVVNTAEQFLEAGIIRELNFQYILCGEPAFVVGSRSVGRQVQPPDGF